MSKNKIGLSTSIIRKNIENNRMNLISIFRFAKKLNVYIVEIVLSENEDTLSNLQKIEQFYKNEYSNEFELLFHVYDWELNKLTLNSNNVYSIFNLSSTFNVHRLIIHPGFYSISLIPQNFLPFAKIAEEFDIDILIENGYKIGELFKSIDEQIVCIKRIREMGATNVYATLDVWRAYKVYHETDKVVQSIETLLESNLLKHIHFSDGKKSLNNSVALGDGEIDVDMLLCALTDFSGYLILELDSEEDAIKSINYLKKRNIF